MVRLVIDDENVLHAHEVGHDALEHLPFRFQRIQFVTTTPLKKLAPAFRQVDTLTKFESVIVGDDDLGSIHLFNHVAWNKFATDIIAVRVVRLKNAQTIFDRQAWGTDQKASGEMFARWVSHRVNSLPRDDHRHNGCLARARCQFQREAHQLGVRIPVRGREMFKYALSVF